MSYGGTDTTDNWSEDNKPVFVDIILIGGSSPKKRYGVSGVKISMYISDKGLRLPRCYT